MENYVGEIRIFTGDFAPEGWHLCDGTLLSINDYSPLFALLGTTYGGDGVSNFGLPDLRGRLPVGQGTGQGLTPRSMGQSFGTETVTVSPAGWPAHIHQVMASSNGTASPTAAGNVLATSTDQVPLYDTRTAPYPFAAPAVGSFQGGGQAHGNMMPSLCINFIIATTGYFPSRP